MTQNNMLPAYTKANQAKLIVIVTSQTFPRIGSMMYLVNIVVMICWMVAEIWAYSIVDQLVAFRISIISSPVPKAHDLQSSTYEYIKLINQKQRSRLQEYLQSTRSKKSVQD